MINWNRPEVYAIKHKNYDVRMASRSGGIFTALSDKVLENGGIVYGCILTEDFMARHIRAERKEERNQMRGSKYIQSELGDIFRNVKADLEADKEVLFSGTSCQISGLKSFLRKEYNKLLCIDIVCHGVPSAKVWKAYLEWQEMKNKGKCIEANFRNKVDYGWSAHIETLIFDVENGQYKTVNSEIFKTLFYGHTILRPCCYKCPYKSVKHPGDITIADYWGIDKAAPGFSDNKGVSLVLINNDKGKGTFEIAKEMVSFQECRIEDSMQPPLIEPFSRPKQRESFWNDFLTMPFEIIAKRYGGYGIVNDMKKLLEKVKGKIKKMIIHV